MCLLDRGWNAHWVLAQPVYVLVRYVDAAKDLAKQSARERGGDADGYKRTFIVPREVREANRRKREVIAAGANNAACVDGE